MPLDHFGQIDYRQCRGPSEGFFAQRTGRNDGSCSRGFECAPDCGPHAAYGVLVESRARDARTATECIFARLLGLGKRSDSPDNFARRVVYAASNGGGSLAAVEALTSMIRNICVRDMRDLSDIISDKNLFECLSDDSPRNEYMRVDANHRGFAMCLRVAGRMINGGLADECFGATRFHYADDIPGWAMSLGYIAQIDNILFYL